MRNVRQGFGMSESSLVDFFVRCVGANFAERVRTHIPFSTANGINVPRGWMAVYADGLGEI